MPYHEYPGGTSHVSLGNGLWIIVPNEEMNFGPITREDIGQLMGGN